MKRLPRQFLLMIGLALFAIGFAYSALNDTQAATDLGDDRLAIVWTSSDPDVAHRMCLMYGHAAKKQNWFSEVTLVVWGPSARLLAGDKSLRDKLKAMAADGVKLQACIVCADSYGVTARLREMGIEVIPMGKPLSDMVKSGWRVLTF